MYVVTRTIKGRHYRYLQRSYRQDGKVRTESIYLGPVHAVRRMAKAVTDFVQAQQLAPEDRAQLAAANAVEKIEREQRERFGETAEERSARERQEALDRLHELYGLRLSGDVSQQNVGIVEPTSTDQDSGPAKAPSC